MLGRILVKKIAAKMLQQVKIAANILQKTSKIDAWFYNGQNY